MATIDQYVEELRRMFPAADERLLRLTLQMMARDQRYACAEAVLTVRGDSNNPWMIDKDEAHGAVINAEIAK